MNDDKYDVLANEDRRRLLHRLDGPEENAVLIPDDVHWGERPKEELHATLHHWHLPKLRAADYIHWNQEQNLVRRGPRFTELQPLLDGLRELGEQRPVEP